MKHWRIPNEGFRYYDSKQNRPENVISPLTSKQIFRYRNFLETLRSSQWNVLVLWDETNRRENVITPVASLSIFAARSFLKQRRVPKENFRNSDTENLRQKNVISPSLIQAIFPLTELLWNTEVFPMQFLGRRRHKMFDGNLHYPRFVHTFLPILESVWNHEDFPIKFSGTVIQKFSTEKRDIPFSHPYKLFADRKILKHRKSSQIKFSLVWDQNVSTGERDILLGSKTCFRCQKLCEKWNWTQRMVFGNVRQKNQPQNLISPSLIHTNFLLPEFLWNPEEFPKIFSVTWDQSFDRTLRYPPSCPYISSNTRTFSNHEAFPIKLSGTVIESFFHGKTWYPPSHP